MDSNSILSTFSSYGVHDLKFAEPLSKHTTWRIGGPADIFVCPRSVEEVKGVMAAAKELNLPWTVIGRGSNLLVLDGGIRGVVIKLSDNFSAIEVHGHRVTAQSGRSIVSAANIAVKHNLQGLEFATGIPGSVGGAVMMNAGAYGGEIKDVLESAKVLDESGTIHCFTNSDFRFAYRYSVLKDIPMVLLEATFRLKEGDGEALLQQIKAWASRRASTQPLSMPNCGSVFRNPEGTHAGRLIEAAGLKGLTRGGAQISEKHANFIVNLGNAKAEDVLWLMRHAEETVRDRFGIRLETEVRIIGEPSQGGEECALV
jgi:UDP-N-acetylmuramate dehydrogenase